MKKWAFGLVAVCGVLLAGCTTGGTSNTGESILEWNSSSGTDLQCCRPARNA